MTILYCRSIGISLTFKAGDIAYETIFIGHKNQPTKLPDNFKTLGGSFSLTDIINKTPNQSKCCITNIS